MAGPRSENLERIRPAYRQKTLILHASLLFTLGFSARLPRCKRVKHEISMKPFVRYRESLFFLFKHFPSLICSGLLERYTKGATGDRLDIIIFLLFTIYKSTKYKSNIFLFSCTASLVFILILLKVRSLCLRYNIPSSSRLRKAEVRFLSCIP
jgi:hypothetical protein